MIMITSTGMYTILGIWAISLFIIWKLLLPMDKKFAGVALILLGLSMSGTENLVTGVETYILAPIWIMIIIGLYLTFTGILETVKRYNK